MVRICDTKFLGDPLKLLSSRVGGREMTLHMLEQARHLTKYVDVRCEGEEVSLGSVEVAPCPLDTWCIASMAEDAEPEPSRRVQWSTQGRLPGRVTVAEDATPEPSRRVQ